MRASEAQPVGATQYERRASNSEINWMVLSIGLRFPSTALCPLMLRSDKCRRAYLARTPATSRSAAGQTVIAVRSRSGTAEMRPRVRTSPSAPRINNVRSKMARLVGVLHTQRVERYQDDPELERYDETMLNDASRVEGKSDEGRHHSLLAGRNARRRESRRGAVRNVSASRHLHPCLRSGDGLRTHSAAPHHPDFHQFAAARAEDVQDLSAVDAACARAARSARV